MLLTFVSPGVAHELLPIYIKAEEWEALGRRIEDTVVGEHRQMPLIVLRWLPGVVVQLVVCGR